MQSIMPNTDISSQEVVFKRVGEFQIVDSGVIHTTIAPIEFSINSLKLEIRFLVDQINLNKELRGKVEPIDPTKLVIEVVNYHTEPSTGFFDPLEIGSVGGVKYYFTFVLNSFISGGKQLSYTLMKKV